MRRINIFSLIGVIFFNLVVTLAAMITIYTLLGSAWVISGSFIISPLLVIMADVFKLQDLTTFQLGSALGLAVIGAALIPFLKRLTSIILNLSKSYLAWNLKAIYA